MDDASQKSEPQYFYGSRFKSLFGAFVCLAFVLLGWWSLQLAGTPRTPEWKIKIAGWLAIISGGSILPLWVSSMVVPNKLMIDRSGFEIKQPLFQTRRFRWSDVERIRVEPRPTVKLIVWDRRRQSGKALNQPGAYLKGTYLPWGWTEPLDVIAEAMNQAQQTSLVHRHDGN